MVLAERVYALSKSFPKEELFGMTSQIRRAAASIPANVAEGWARQHTAEFLQFLRIARGSLRELETHLLLSQRVGLCSDKSIRAILDEADILGRQILALQRSLQQKRE